MTLINNLINNKQWNYALSVLFFVFLLINDFNFYTALGIALTLFSFFSYIRNLGDELPVLELMLLLCGYQWIVASYYSYLNGDVFYPMAVDENTYMSITVLLYAGLIIGVFAKKKSIRITKEVLDDIMSTNENKKFVYILIAVGLLANLTRSFIPGPLMFVNHLVSSFFYIGAVGVLYTNIKFKWLIFLAVFGYLFLRVISSGVFNEFLSWGFFVTMFLANIFKPSKIKIIALLSAAIVFISVLQSVKPFYRSYIWNGYQGNKLVLFLEIFKDGLTGNLNENDLNETELYDQLNSRANQGWVFSMVYDHVPNKQPFANGSTIISAITDSFLPRFLFPNKASTVSKDLFTRYTGKELNDKTAMGLGIPGEGYANFGKIGAFIFMLIYGIIISWITRIYQNKSVALPIILFFVPIYFEMIIRAISNFSQVINWQVKVTVLFWLLFLYYKRNYYKPVLT